MLIVSLSSPNMKAALTLSCKRNKHFTMKMAKIRGKELKCTSGAISLHNPVAEFGKIPWPLIVLRIFRQIRRKGA
jgi:hypothetical protein